MDVDSLVFLCPYLESPCQTTSLSPPGPRGAGWPVPSSCRFMCLGAPCTRFASFICLSARTTSDMYYVRCYTVSFYWSTISTRAGMVSAYACPKRNSHIVRAHVTVNGMSDLLHHIDFSPASGLPTESSVAPWSVLRSPLGHKHPVHC